MRWCLLVFLALAGALPSRATASPDDPSVPATPAEPAPVEPAPTATAPVVVAPAAPAAPEPGPAVKQADTVGAPAPPRRAQPAKRPAPFAPRSGFTVEASTGVAAIHSPAGMAGGPSLYNFQIGAFLTPRTSIGLRLASASALLETSDGGTLWFNARFLGLSVQRWLGEHCFVSLGSGTFAASPGTDSPFRHSYEGAGVDLRLAVAQPLSARTSAFAAFETMVALSNIDLATTSLVLGIQVF
jgi:hypothetical protein